jgi:hypothetical protein
LTCTHPNASRTVQRDTGPKGHAARRRQRVRCDLQSVNHKRRQQERVTVAPIPYEPDVQARHARTRKADPVARGPPAVASVTAPVVMDTLPPVATPAPAAMVTLTSARGQTRRGRAQRAGAEAHVVKLKRLSSKTSHTAPIREAFPRTQVCTLHTRIQTCSPATRASRARCGPSGQNHFATLAVGAASRLARGNEAASPRGYRGGGHKRGTRHGGPTTAQGHPR